MTETEAKPRILETAEEVAPPATSLPSPERKKKRRRRRWSSLSYTTRVTLAFALIAAMTALVAIGVVSFVWEQHFRTYTADNMQTLCETTANRIAAIYEETGDLWNPETTRPAAQATELTSGVGVRVIDLKGSTVFDSSVIIDEQQGDVFTSFAPQDRSQAATASIVLPDGEKVGTVRLWVYGSEALMRQPDQEFRDNSYQAMFIAGGVAIVLASCIGFLFARNLVSPINRIMKTARAIGDGDLSARTKLTGEDEVARLGETFDVMAESVEKDRDLERRLTTDGRPRAAHPAHGHPGHGGGHDRRRLRGRRGAPGHREFRDPAPVAAGECAVEAVSSGKPRRAHEGGGRQRRRAHLWASSPPTRCSCPIPASPWSTTPSPTLW